MNSVKIGTYQMDTAFGLYLPEYTIPAPSPQTKFVKIIGRDGSVDLSDAIGLHYDSRSWSLDFKCFDPTVNWHTLTSSVMNAIHGKRLNFEFDDDPDYFWTGRISVSSYVSTRGTGTLKVNITSDPFKYAKLSTIVTKTASTGTEYTGSMVTFNNGLIYDLSADIEPTQDLHGYTTPWPAGGGKNKIVPLDKSFTNNGVPCVCSASAETISLNGTATGSGGRTGKMTKDVVLPAGTYILSVTTVSGTSQATYIVNRTDNNNYISGSQFSLAEETSVYVGANVANGTVYDEVVHIQIEQGSTASTWEPYENICPISGLTGLSVYRTGKNLFDSDNLEAVSAPAGDRWGHKYPAAGTYAIKAYGVGANAYLYARVHNTDNTWSSNYYIVGNTTATAQIITITSGQTLYVFDALEHTESQSSDLFSDWKVQVAFSSTQPAAYEPYNGNTYSVDWSTQAGTVYHGTVDVVTGLLTVDRASVLFDGTQTVGLYNWRPNSSSVGWLYAPSVTPGLLNVEINSSNLQSCGLLSDTLETVVYGGSTGVYGKTSPCISLVGGTNWGVAMRLNDTTLTTAAKINEYLSANPIRVVYKLATPVTYQLTPQEIGALVSTNNVWSSSGDVSVTVVTPETVTNNGLPIVPTVTASADMVLRWGNYSASVQQGTSTIPQLVLETGDNKIYIIGTGNISFEWSEASL